MMSITYHQNSKSAWQFLILICLIFYISACTSQETVTPTAVAISKELATVEISATPNAEQVAATRSAVSATPVPPTATIIPTETPYVGIFIGEAQQEEGFLNFSEPILGPAIDLAQPTADARRCLGVQIDTPYVTAWRTNATVSQRMGCPIQGGFGFFGEVQIFETGVMYFYPELNAVWAIRPLQDGNSGDFDYLENPTEISNIGVQPPQGLIVPGGIFGNMWASVAGLRDEMGFARTESQDAPLGLQRFENGTFLLDSNASQIYALITDGTVLGPFLASETEPGLVSTPTPVGTSFLELTEEVEVTAEVESP